MSGWIKLHRKLIESDIFQNEKLLKIFIYCLLKATHQEHSQLIGLRTIELKKGQFVFGRSKAATELNMKESTVWKYMKFLESIKTISIDSNNKFSVITIENWEFYQGIPEEVEQQNNNKITTKEQQNNTNKNVKNVKNVKNLYIEQFEKLWTMYPNKKGKATAKKKVAKLLKDEEVTYEELKKCIERYKQYVINKRASSQPNLQYQHGSTFFNGSYIDYLDSNYEEEQSNYNEEQNSNGKVADF